MKRKTRFGILLALLAIGAALLIAIVLFRRQPMPDLRQVDPPEGTQLFIFPVANGVITAGYRNPAYLEKNHFIHYGTDLTAANGGHAEILASGAGIVLGTEFCDNSLGNIAVIRYEDVFVPQTGETVSLIARYYHMTSLLVEKNDVVSPGQAIGTIDGGHKWYNHVHLELDADLEYPFHTPQAAESASELLNRYPANGEQTLEPISVLVVDKGQRIFVHPNSDCCTEKDNPRFAAKQ